MTQIIHNHLISVQTPMTPMTPDEQMKSGAKKSSLRWKSDQGEQQLGVIKSLNMIEKLVDGRGQSLCSTAV
jgi:hypothetical protein